MFYGYSSIMLFVVPLEDTRCALLCVNALEPSVNFSCLFKQCYSYECAIFK